MPRMSHGSDITEAAHTRQRENSTLESLAPLEAAAATIQPPLHAFDYLFPALQNDPDALLPETDPALTVSRLRALAATMGDDNTGASSQIPAAYTYFGQFVDHDITLEALTDPTADSLAEILKDDMSPMSLTEARSAIKNERAATFDLDSVYGLNVPVPHDPADNNKLLVGDVSATGSDDPPLKRPEGKGDANDVPRQGRSADNTLDRAALIGDPRNDENTVISQLQVAFLHAHNKLVDEGFSFEQARGILRQHYQHIVINDFLRVRIADPKVVDDIVDNGNRWYDALSEPFFMPFEFSVAAYRFGHTMVRAEYDFNENFNLGAIPASLEFLFTFTALSGQLGFPGGEFDTLPENWIIEWEKLIGDDVGPGGLARPIDSTISAITSGQGPHALFALRDLEGKKLPDLAAVLAARNLLRGYRRRMPTGQAVAKHLGLPVLQGQRLRDAVPTAQGDALADGDFLDRTPLWFYVLAEAGNADGDTLGPVGSTIVAEVLIGLVRRSADSILRVPGWRAALPSKTPGTFDLADLLRFAGVLKGGTPVETYVVRSGDTLSQIARRKLDDAARWPELFAANRTIVRNPNQIFPGMRLVLPSGPPADPQPRFIVVKPGDTLSGIAKQHLGFGDRWPEIFKLNGGVLTNPNVIIPGQVLLLPDQ
ncbi:MAG: LysM peptidoglycan-binding domain-containing protein [Mycobacterium sp.]